MQLENVQQKTFGRKLHGYPAKLKGYNLSMIEINDEAVVTASGERYHPIVTYTTNPADEIEGTVFLITEQELKEADDYEVDDYKRISVVLVSGESAWIYIRK